MYQIASHGFTIAAAHKMRNVSNQEELSAEWMEDFVTFVEQNIQAIILDNGKENNSSNFVIHLQFMALRGSTLK